MSEEFNFGKRRSGEAEMLLHIQQRNDTVPAMSVLCQICGKAPSATGISVAGSVTDVCLSCGLNFNPDEHGVDGTKKAEMINAIEFALNVEEGIAQDSHRDHARTAVNTLLATGDIHLNLSADVTGFTEPMEQAAAETFMEEVRGLLARMDAIGVPEGMTVCEPRHRTVLLQFQSLVSLIERAERLAALDTWINERYRIAFQTRDTLKMRSHAGTLYFIETGRYPYSDIDPKGWDRSPSPTFGEFQNTLESVTRQELDEEFARRRRIRPKKQKKKD